MTARVVVEQRADRVLAALAYNTFSSAQEIADAIGTVQCFCLSDPRCKVGQYASGSACICVTTRRADPIGGIIDREPGWRPAGVADVRPLLNRFEKQGLVTACREARRTVYRLTRPRTDDLLEDIGSLPAYDPRSSA